MQISKGARHDFLRRHGVPTNWQASTLGQLARVVGGGTPSRDVTQFWARGTTPWATPTDLTANRSKYIDTTAECITEAGLRSSAAELLPAGSVLYTSRATIGSKAIAAVPIATNQGFASFVPQAVNGDYLYYALDLLTPTIRRLGAGTTFDEVSKRDIRTVWCSIPKSPDEQAAIARILDAVDTAIENTNAAVERAQQFERTVLEDAFRRLQAKVQPLREFISDIRYGTSRASSAYGWGNPVLRIPNVVADRLSLDDLAYVELSPADVERLTLQDGDLLLVRTNGNPNYVGRSVVFRQPDERVWVYASYLIRVRLKPGLLPDFVNVFLGLDQGRRELLQRVTTSAGNHNINSNSIRLLRIPVPGKEDAQADIVKLATACRRQVDALLQKATVLQQLKQSLMHDLLTGRVRVGTTTEEVTA